MSSLHCHDPCIVMMTSPTSAAAMCDLTQQRHIHTWRLHRRVRRSAIGATPSPCAHLAKCPRAPMPGRAAISLSMWRRRLLLAQRVTACSESAPRSNTCRIAAADAPPVPIVRMDRAHARGNPTKMTVWEPEPWKERKKMRMRMCMRTACRACGCPPAP